MRIAAIILHISLTAGLTSTLILLMQICQAQNCSPRLSVALGGLVAGAFVSSVLWLQEWLRS